MPAILPKLKKSVAVWSVLSVLVGAAGGYGLLAHRAARASEDCCAPGAPCCYPGSPCCARSAAARH